MTPKRPAKTKAQSPKMPWQKQPAEDPQVGEPTADGNGFPGDGMPSVGATPMSGEDVFYPAFEAWNELKQTIHRKLIDQLDLRQMNKLERVEMEPQVREIAQKVLSEQEQNLNHRERGQLVAEVLAELFGYGPLEGLLEDDTVSDILVNSTDFVYVERFGKIEKTNVSFKSEKHLLQIIERIVNAVGRRIDESSPMVDARLPDGSRVNAIIPPLAIDGPHLSIRKFRSDVLGADDLLKGAALTKEMLTFLRGVVRARLNVLISGGTGSGKTTLLNVLSESIPARERIVTVEDSAELRLRQPHVVRLETRPPNVEGEGQISQRQLVINSLRMRPDRIILGEVRGPEAVDMLQAMNTGHDGSLTTLHANSPRDALSRLNTMVSMAGLQIPPEAIREQIASAINLLVHVTRLSDGQRRISQISEIVGTEGNVVSLQDIFIFKQTGVDPSSGAVRGEFRSTGVRPQCSDRLEAYGINLAETLFSAETQAVQGGELL